MAEGKNNLPKYTTTCMPLWTDMQGSFGIYDNTLTVPTFSSRVVYIYPSVILHKEHVELAEGCALCFLVKRSASSGDSTPSAEGVRHP